MLVKGFNRLILSVVFVSLLALAALLLVTTRGRIPFAVPWSNIIQDRNGLLQHNNGAQESLHGHTGNFQDEVDDVSSTHTEIASLSTPDGKYFRITFGHGDEGMNPSIIPHPTKPETFLVVAQQVKPSSSNSAWFAELVCEATFFTPSTLQCISPAKILPIAATPGDKCTGDLGYFSLSVGPHDARVFHGPQHPWVVFGSNSQHTCFGQWAQDLRTLVDWQSPAVAARHDPFFLPAELTRPPPWGPIEKNWFLFWDSADQPYVHYDVAPRRTFAKLGGGGLVGDDLAPLASPYDEKCLARYLPPLAKELESIHQATNSLAVTLCDRATPECQPSDANTFVLTIFQHKSYYDFHSVYEPYAMLFRRAPPFEIVGISSKPIWVRGRVGNPSGGHSEMLYITSISWKSREQQYHGYMDDTLFIGFGIEDAGSGGIDVRAGDLLRDMGMCSDL